MNLILGNFDDLVKFIHPVDVRGARTTANDAVLLALGRGLAGAMQSACNRFFARAVDTTWEGITYGQAILPRYPLEGISKVETRDYPGEWTEVALGEVIADLDAPTGLVALAVQGRVRITYTGGYWVNTLEPTESGYPATLPGGAHPLPVDLAVAWLIGTQHAWEHKDHWTPKVMANSEPSPLRLTDLTTLPIVADAIAAYRRILL